MATLKIGTRDLWYEVQGDGEPLLLIPGLGLDHHYYDLAQAHLLTGCQTIVFDPCGLGRSSKPPPDSYSYSIGNWAEDVGCLIQHLGHDKVNVLGSSLGASVAMELAVAMPDVFNSLTIIGGLTEVDKALLANLNFRERLIEAHGMSDLLADFMAMSTISRAFRETPQGQHVLQRLAEAVKLNSPDLYLAFINAAKSWVGDGANGYQWTSKVREIDMPVLAIAGDNDTFIPAELTKIVADNIQDSQFHEINGGGHIPMIEKPAETCAIVMQFLASHPF